MIEILSYGQSEIYKFAEVWFAVIGRITAGNLAVIRLSRCPKDERFRGGPPSRRCYFPGKTAKTAGR
jgi:hypothetical protein